MKKLKRYRKAVAAVVGTVISLAVLLGAPIDGETKAALVTLISAMVAPLVYQLGNES
jgi:4-hydroxybenzoate polyprenyltransferase